jgi:UDP:flavonoid glycosyltransferase YjiC (YdhE family)
VTVDAIALAEGAILANVNSVLDACAMPRARSLAQVLESGQCFLTTFAELDHYGARAHGNYVGPINDLGPKQMLTWPHDSQNGIFAYLRPDTPLLSAVLQALAECGRRVVCYAPGVPGKLCDRIKGPFFAFADRPVHLPALFQKIDLCVSYAPAGFVTSGLLSGIPQLLSPAHAEAQLTAHRVELLGGGLVLRGDQSASSVGKLINTLLQVPRFRDRTRMFSQRYADFDPETAADTITEHIESAAA